MEGYQQLLVDAIPSKQSQEMQMLYLLDDRPGQRRDFGTLTHRRVCNINELQRL